MMLKSKTEHPVGVIRSKPAFPHCHNLQQESSPLVSSTICSPPSQEPLTGGSGTLTRTKRLRLICILTNKQTNCGRIRWTWSTSGPIQTGRGGETLRRSNCPAQHVSARRWVKRVLRPDWNKRRLHQRKHNPFLSAASLSTTGRNQLKCVGGFLNSQSSHSLSGAPNVQLFFFFFQEIFRPQS